VILDCNSSIRANKEVASVDWLLVDDIVRARTEREAKRSGWR
jgi:hypothetical protein